MKRPVTRTARIDIRLTPTERDDVRAVADEMQITVTDVLLYAFDKLKESRSVKP